MSPKVDLIIVTGAERSATSLVTGALALCGAWCSSSVRPWDVRASLEDRDVLDSLTKPLFRGLGADPRGQRPLPSMERLFDVAPKIAPRWRSRLSAILTSGGYADGPVVVESRAACLAWPVWTRAFPDARWVIVRRDDAAIVESCLRTRYMTGYSDRAGWTHWLSTIKGRFHDLESFHPESIYAESIFDGELRGLRELVETLSLEWNESALRDGFAPIYWQNGLFDETAIVAVEGA